MEGFEFMGAKLDPVKNVEGNRKESVISADDSKVKICVIPTDEEIVIARGYPVHRDRQADRIKGNPVGQACRQPQITARHACFFLANRYGEES